MLSLTLARLITSLKPSTAALASRGIDQEIQETVVDHYILAEKVPSKTNEEHTIQEFLARYVDRSIEIFGGIILVNPCIKKGEVLIIGYLELDPIVITKEGQIHLIDHISDQEILPVAKNEECFSEVIGYLYLIFTQRILGDNFDPDIEAIQLANIANIDRSADFYRVILG